MGAAADEGAGALMRKDTSLCSWRGFLDRRRMRLFTLVIFFALCSVALCSSANNCTATQNQEKVANAQAVLNCGTQQCSTVSGASQQKCLCTNCKSQNEAAEKASCACGGTDPDSVAACRIYRNLNAKCSGVAACAPSTLFVFIAFALATRQWW